MITVGEAVKRRLLQGTQIRSDDDGMFLDYDTLTITSREVKFEKNGEVLATLNDLHHFDPLTNVLTLRGLEGKLRVKMEVE